MKCRLTGGGGRVVVMPCLHDQGEGTLKQEQGRLEICEAFIKYMTVMKTITPPNIPRRFTK